MLIGSCYVYKHRTNSSQCYHCWAFPQDIGFYTPARFLDCYFSYFVKILAFRQVSISSLFSHVRYILSGNWDKMVLVGRYFYPRGSIWRNIIDILRQCSLVQWLHAEMQHKMREIICVSKNFPRVLPPRTAIYCWPMISVFSDWLDW